MKPESDAVWAPYGLRHNPFFTRPLSSVAGIDRGIHLFRGKARIHEADKLVQRILNDTNSVRLIEGPTGIGKTTLANLIKSKLLDRDDVAVSLEPIQIDPETMTPERFAAEILFATLFALKRHPSAQDAAAAAKTEAEGRVLDKLLSGKTRKIGFSKIIGVEWTRTLILREATTRPFGDWKEALLNVQASAEASGVNRILLHINNLDQATITSPERVGSLFGNMRDLLQLDGYHFILCANEAFRTRALAERTNVTDLFGNPLLPAALRPAEVEEIVMARYDDAKGQTAKFSPPIAPREVAKLFELYEGELRSVFEMLGQTFMEELGPSATPRQLTAEDVVRIQRPLVEALLERLSEAQYDVLRALSQLQPHATEPVQQKDLVDHLRKSRGGEAYTQGYVSQVADALADAKWIAKYTPNRRRTYYSLGGRAKIARDAITAV